MPFTPFHFGLGLLFKGVSPRNFSLTAFAATQVAIDVETLHFIVRNEYPLHRVCHTLVGASLVGLATAGVVFACTAAFRRRLPAVAGSERESGFTGAFRAEVSAVGTVTGGLVGGITHSLFDAMMHSDMRPLEPWIAGNPLLGLLAPVPVAVVCVGAGVLGLAIVGVRLLCGAGRAAR